MAAYQRLSNNEHENANSNINVNDDESSLLNFGENNNNKNNKLSTSAAVSGGFYNLHHRSSHHQQQPQHQQHYDHNSQHIMDGNIVAAALDDTTNTTLEVPLIEHNNRLHFVDCTESTAPSTCRCQQVGFAAAAKQKSKSTQEAKCKILLAISLCGVFMIIEFIGGYMANSLAIMTDAAHLAVDGMSFFISLVAILLGSRPPTKKMTFGFKRLEVMGAIISIVAIWIITATLIVIAIERIYSDEYDVDGGVMMVISLIGILINVIMIYVLHGSSLHLDSAHGHSHSATDKNCSQTLHPHQHHEQPQDDFTHSDILLLTDDDENTPKSTTMDNMTMTNGGIAKQNIDVDNTQHNTHQQLDERNLNLRAALIHVIGDLIQSIGVFLAALIIKFYPSAQFIDPLCTLLFSIIVIMTTIRLFKDSMLIIMEAVPPGISMDNLVMDLMNIEGVKSLHHIHVWNFTTDYSVLMVHLVIDFFSDSNSILDKATKLACSNKYNIKHCTIQIERETA